MVNFPLDQLSASSETEKAAQQQKMGPSGEKGELIINSQPLLIIIIGKIVVTRK